MKVVIDHRRLARRARLSHAASLGGLLAILASAALTLFRPDLSTAGAVLLVGGFAVATVGIAQANRWVKRPRPEDVLDGALKGLDDRHRLYHYLDGLPPHLLLTPSGVVVLETRAGEGVYEYRNGRWSQRMTLGKALRFFVEEPLGDPVQEAETRATLLAQALRRRLRAATDVPTRAVVVFTHPATIVRADGPRLPVVQPKNLRRHAGATGRPLSAETYATLRTLLDSKVRGD